MDPPLPDDFGLAEHYGDAGFDDPFHDDEEDGDGDEQQEAAVNEPNWFELGLAAVIAGFGWFVKRLVSRQDELERTAVRKCDFDQLADTVRADVSALHERIDRKFDEQTRQIFEMLRDRR